MTKPFLQKLWLPDLSCATPRRFRQAAFVLAALFVATSAWRFLVNPSGGHVHRQSDTMGMALRFAEEFRHRGLAALDFFLYPRILSSGPFNGINATEFPLLNVIGGFFHLTAEDPFVGFFLTGTFILLVNLYVAYVEFPKLLEAWGVKLEAPVAMLVWLSTAAVASQTNIIMPEGLSIPLAVAAAARILDPKARTRNIALGILLANLALAIKPTAVFTLGAVVFAPLFRERYAKRAPALLAATALCFLFPGWWFGVQAKVINAAANGPTAFAPANLQLVQNLVNLGPKNIAHLFLQEPYQGQLPMFVGWLFVLAGIFLKEWWAVALYFLALFGSFALGGNAVLWHGYYLVGACGFALLLMGRVLGASGRHRYLRWAALACVVWGVLFEIRINIWVAGRASHHGKLKPYEFGRAVRPEIPAGYAIITDDDNYPKKLLLLGRSGEDAGGRVYTACDQAYYAGQALALVSDAPPPLGQAICGGRPREIRHVMSGGMKWYITLIQ